MELGTGRLGNIRTSAILRLSDFDPTGNIRRLNLLHRAEREDSQFRSLSRSLGLPSTPISEEIRDGASKLFLLGSGASVEELTYQHWEHIGEHQSIGINSWVIHDFVPDFYSLETSKVPGTPSVFEKGLRREVVLAKQPKVLLPAAYFLAPSDQRIDFPATTKENLRPYPKISLGTRQPALLQAAVEDFLHLRQRGKIPPTIVPSVSASMDRLAMLGLLANCSAIIFVGVDLNSTEYFYERNPQYLHNLGLSTLDHGQTGAVHKTDDPRQKRFVVSHSLRVLQEVAASEFDARFFVASGRSALADFMPVYAWPQRTSPCLSG